MTSQERESAYKKQLAVILARLNGIEIKQPDKWLEWRKENDPPVLFHQDRQTPGQPNG